MTDDNKKELDLYGTDVGAEEKAGIRLRSQDRFLGSSGCLKKYTF